MLTGKHMAAPTPSTMRKITTTCSLGAAPHTAEAMPNTATPAIARTAGIDVHGKKARAATRGGRRVGRAGSGKEPRGERYEEVAGRAVPSGSPRWARRRRRAPPRPRLPGGEPFGQLDVAR